MKKTLRIFSAYLLAAFLTASSYLLPVRQGIDSPWLLSLSAPSERSAVTAEQFPSILCGSWSGFFPTLVTKEKYVEDPVIMNVLGTPGDQRLVFEIESYGDRYLFPNEWSISEGKLLFSLYDPSWRMEIELHALSETELSGTLLQYGEEFPVTLYKRSDVATDPTAGPRFVFENEEASVWQEKLAAYPSFSQGGESIPFSYELWRWDRSMPLISRCPELASAVQAGDLQTMKAVMDVVCNHFIHDGNSGMPETTDLQSVLHYYDSSGGTGIECRGMSVLLSEMLRLCGIPAKPVTCLPENDPCEECHVLVHAYSSELQQWVLLDPTYRLMLQDVSGRYIGLPQLRQALITGEELIANTDAGHNGMPFSLDWYRAYMTKNTFRFSSAVHFSALSQENGEGVERWMLIPEGFSLPYWAQRPERVTTSAEAFWAAP
ncbi:MAG: transglutaminase domain-containing protein [Provencibacterium sp.]|jgi:transglutaminase-like putative cysteine protease|nr:transglutaminase domain-containing protein [Provencibacterium sp.]